MEYFELDVDLGFYEEGEYPEVEGDILDYMGPSLELLSQSVTAKRGSAFDELLDWLFVIGLAPLLWSARVYKGIQTLRLCPTIEWYPVEVTWRKKVYPYYVGGTVTRNDIWNYEQSEFTRIYDERPADKSNVGLMRKPVVDPQLVPEFDLFHTRFDRWIGTDVFRSLWLNSGFNGMKFTQLDQRSCGAK